MADILVKLMLVITGVFIIYIIFPSLIKILLRNRFLKNIQKSGCLCLTFDDGPNPKTTPLILDLLKQAKVKATFFVLGKNAEKYPDIITVIIENGHEVEEHSYEHSHAFKSGPFRTAKDLIYGGRVVERLVPSSKSNLIRPPFGKLNFVSLLYIWLKKKDAIFWSIDPKDYANSSGQTIADFVIQRLNPGSVILLHDARGDTSRIADTTVSAVKLILEKSANSGLNFVTVKDALKLASKISV